MTWFSRFDGSDAVDSFQHLADSVERNQREAGPQDFALIAAVAEVSVLVFIRLPLAGVKLLWRMIRRRNKRQRDRYYD